MRPPYAVLMRWPPGRWGTTELYLPANLRREELRECIEAHVKQLLAQTAEWPVVIGCPDGGRELSADTLRWFVEYRTGDPDQETRWRSVPTRHHRP